jgi:hypothetical protein
MHRAANIGRRFEVESLELRVVSLKIEFAVLFKYQNYEP